ncbi:MAG: (Fe-S)-binding protein [Deltaproteobacteria bacterium]|jgi:glycolate oxidase iron-sulfur subunit|nr:(Fe-S)-binding protein [Deltaproteobacteria bacterium]
MAGYEEISRCNRCGFCQSVCPTYLHSQDEVQVARARIYLTKLLIEGKYDFTKDSQVAKKVDQCLLCGACTAACPASVKTDEIMVAARNDFASNRGLKLFQKLVYRGLLPSKDRLEKVVALLNLYEKSGARRLLYGQTLRRALDRLVYYDSFLPDKLSQPARAGLASVIRAQGQAKLKIVYFLGCASNVFWAQTVRRSLAYLAARGVEIHLPPSTCCGEPHRSSGDLEETRRLGLKNAPLIFQANYDFIVTDCSTCAKALSRYDQFVGADSKEGQRLRAFLPKVLDLNTFVVEKLGSISANLKPSSFSRVTYHDPCHALRGLGIREAPRAILKAIPNLEFIELEGAEVCCGGAGSYGFNHPEMGGRLAESKRLRIAQSGADLVSTSCPACALQLGAGLKRAGQSIAMVHPVELLAESAQLGVFKP